MLRGLRTKEIDALSQILKLLEKSLMLWRIL